MMEREIIEGLRRGGHLRSCGDGFYFVTAAGQWETSIHKKTAARLIGGLVKYQAAKGRAARYYATEWAGRDGHCQRCGCTDTDGCNPRCYWYPKGHPHRLCSGCNPEAPIIPPATYGAVAEELLP